MNRNDFTNAKIAEDTGDILEALRIYRDAWQQDNTDRDALRGMGQCALLMDKPEIALNFFVKLLILNHDDPWGYLGRAQVMLCFDQIDRACADIARVIALDAPASEIRIDCAAALNECGQSALARNTLAPIRDAFWNDADFRAEWLFALIASGEKSHPDVAEILKIPSNDALLQLCRLACQTAPDTRSAANILDEWPDLLIRAEILGLSPA